MHNLLQSQKYSSEPHQYMLKQNCPWAFTFFNIKDSENQTVND